jgi:peptidoglycan hydrolase CwlO-like protein
MNWENVFATTVIGIITGLGGYFVGKPKRRAETRQTMAEAIQKELMALTEIIESWRDQASALRVQVDEQEKLIAKQQKEIKQQKQVVQDLQAKIEELRDKIEKQCSDCNYKNEKP